MVSLADIDRQISVTNQRLHAVRGQRRSDPDEELLLAERIDRMLDQRLSVASTATPTAAQPNR